MKGAKWIIGLFALATSASAENLIGTYSSLHFNEEGGDLLGMEILILPSAAGAGENYTAVVQIAEGGAPDVFVLSITNLKDDRFHLQLPDGLKLEAIAKERALIINWPNGDTDSLQKGRSYWSK